MTTATPGRRAGTPRSWIAELWRALIVRPRHRVEVRR